MELKVVDGGVVSASDTVFGQEFNQSLVHQAVVAFLAGGRSGTRAQKNRSSVSGGGAKPWRQKGTGRARAGTIRSPLWRTGGVTFAAQPRDFGQKINQKMYRSAMRSIFSELVRGERMTVVEDFQVDSHKTRDLVAKLQSLDLEDVLIVDSEVSDNLRLASRNLHKVNAVSVDSASPVSLIGHENIVVTKAALAKIEEWLA
ncbi:MAG: 50S ribosomal protein L4 [bacterium]